MEIVTQSEDETINAGFEFAKNLTPGDVVGLSGDLGAGKTRFIKGICSYFQVKEPVNSPTFIIVNEYKGQFNNETMKIFHFDLYRLNNPDELINLGLDNYFTNESICLIEWIENGSDIINPNHLVELGFGNADNERIINLNE
jgi:tRNA threonylcarbamoyladenosine biosynthesis protein TsaE